MGEGPWRRLALYRARQADAEWLCLSSGQVHHWIDCLSLLNFNGRMRDELLIEALFHSLDHARSIIAVWAKDYDTARPHSALN